MLCLVECPLADRRLAIMADTLGLHITSAIGGYVMLRLALADRKRVETSQLPALTSLPAPADAIRSALVAAGLAKSWGMAELSLADDTDWLADAQAGMGGEVAAMPTGEEVREALERVRAKYLEYYPRRRAQARSKATGGKVRARLVDGYTSRDLCEAIDGCMSSRYHVEGGYTSLSLILRDAAHVDRFIALARGEARDRVCYTSEMIRQAEAIAYREAYHAACDGDDTVPHAEADRVAREAVEAHRRGGLRLVKDVTPRGDR